jgi:O-antigen/teichoic acid export membrane protein
MTVTQASSEFSLKRRVLGASIWSIAGYGFNLCIRFGGNLVMTRLLLPEMYGVMAVASIVLTGLAMFSDFGLKPNVIQSRRGDDPAYLNTIWVTQIVRGAVLYAAALMISLLVLMLGRIGAVPEHSVYADPSVPPVIAVLSITMVIAGFESTKLLQASREIALARLTMVEVGSQLGGLVTMLAWAALDRSIWALVAGAIVAALSRTTLSYAALPGIGNRWQWDQAAFREIVGVGKWIFLSSVSFFFAGNGDRMLLGTLVDAKLLGTYAIAYLFFSSVEQILTRIIVDVSFPALGEVHRTRPERLKHAYYRFHTLISAGTYFIVGILATSGHSLIAVLYDPRYLQAGRTLEILSVALLTLPFRVATQSFLLFGAARLYFWFNLMRTVALFVAIPIGFQLWGYPGALWGIVLSYFANLPLIMVHSARFGLFDLRRELLGLPALAVGLAIGSLVNQLAALLH